MANKMFTFLLTEKLSNDVILAMYKSGDSLLAVTAKELMRQMQEQKALNEILDKTK